MFLLDLKGETIAREGDTDNPYVMSEGVMNVWIDSREGSLVTTIVAVQQSQRNKQDS